MQYRFRQAVREGRTSAVLGKLAGHTRAEPQPSSRDCTSTELLKKGVTMLEAESHGKARSKKMVLRKMVAAIYLKQVHSIRANRAVYMKPRTDLQRLLMEPNMGHFSLEICQRMTAGRKTLPRINQLLRLTSPAMDADEYVCEEAKSIPLLALAV